MLFTEVNLYQLAIENIARVKEVQNALDEDGSWGLAYSDSRCHGLAFH